MRVLMLAPQPFFEPRGAPFCVRASTASKRARARGHDRPRLREVEEAVDHDLRRGRSSAVRSRAPTAVRYPVTSASPSTPRPSSGRKFARSDRPSRG